MFVIRPAKREDLSSIVRCAQSTSIGILSLPKNRKAMEAKLNWSIDSFTRTVKKPSHEFYLFVLEKVKTGMIAGTCGIYAKMGSSSPQHFFEVRLKNRSKSPPFCTQYHLLFPTAITSGPSELCALYLNPNYRNEGLGSLLSFSRLLFIEDFQHRFTSTVTARLRGQIRQKDLSSPFWSGVGAHFLEESFEKALKRAEDDPTSIPHIFPPHPIYLELLPKTCSCAIHKTHAHTRPALKMLKKQGFCETGWIDLFDGGPVVSCELDQIECLKKSVRLPIQAIKEEKKRGRAHLLSNCKMNFRATCGHVKMHKKTGLTIEPLAAKALEVCVGDFLRVTPLQRRGT